MARKTQDKDQKRRVRRRCPQAYDMHPSRRVFCKAIEFNCRLLIENVFPDSLTDVIHGLWFLRLPLTACAPRCGLGYLQCCVMGLILQKTNMVFWCVIARSSVILPILIITVEEAFFLLFPFLFFSCETFSDLHTN